MLFRSLGPTPSPVGAPPLTASVPVDPSPVRTATESVSVALPVQTRPGWPVDDNEGPPVLWVWMGANFMNPQWVSCDDSGAYCIEGEGSSKVNVIRLKGLELVGAVPVSTPDPAKALRDMGLSSAAVQQLLRPGS